MDFSRLKPMTRERFYAWAQADGGRYEFDGVQPVAMADINIGHSVVTGNIICYLANHLAAKSGECPGPGAGIATIGQTVRYPDAVVTCSKIDGEAYLCPTRSSCSRS
jgi:putative cofactor-binding repeat protein